MNMFKRPAEVVKENNSQDAKSVEKGNEEQPKITLTPQELSDLIDQKVANALSKQPKVEEKKSKEPEQFQKISINDDIPELENFEFKNRVYEIIGAGKTHSHGIRNRSKGQSLLMYNHPVTKESFSLRFSSNQTSFFEEKQSKEKGSVKIRYINVKDNLLFVPATDVRLQQFLHIHPDKGIVFREVDKTADAKKNSEKLDLSFKAESLVRGLEFAHQDALARMICDNYQEEASSAIILHDLFQKVRTHTNPELVIRLAEDEDLLIQGIAKVAVKRGYLSYVDYRFKDKDGVVILDVGRNQNEWKAIAEYLKSNEGAKLRDFLEEKLY